MYPETRTYFSYIGFNGFFRVSAFKILRVFGCITGLYRLIEFKAVFWRIWRFNPDFWISPNSPFFTNFPIFGF